MSKKHFEIILKNINWETDGQNINLPNDVVLFIEGNTKGFAIDMACDVASNKYGFLVNSVRDTKVKECDFSNSNDPSDKYSYIYFKEQNNLINLDFNTFLLFKKSLDVGKLDDMVLAYISKFPVESKILVDTFKDKEINYKSLFGCLNDYYELYNEPEEIDEGIALLEGDLEKSQKELKPVGVIKYLLNALDENSDYNSKKIKNSIINVIKER